MKLRENHFSLGEFDHLYINFTTRDIPEQFYLSNEVDRYHPWYRKCYVHVEKNFYDNLDTTKAPKDIIQIIGNILTSCFSSEDFSKSRILSFIQQAVDEGENMLMKFKEKSSAKRKAIVFLRFLDTCKFYPLLKVYDENDKLIYEKDLPEAMTLDYLGDIQISTKRVTIKPRKNAFTTQYEPLVFEF